jgi:hypothetical protein
VCLTTGPNFLLKRALHIVRSRDSSFRSIFSLRSSSNSYVFFLVLRWIHITLTWRGTTSRQMPSVKWDHVSYRRSAHTVLTWRGNASRFDQVWSVCRAVVVSSSLFVQLWAWNGCLVMCIHLKYLFAYFQ